MEIRLDPMQGYVKEDGKFDLKKALISSGVKAAICYKETIDNVAVSPSMVREMESDKILLNRGLNTLRDQHSTPNEHQVVSLEITGIPKAFLMVLNNEKQYTADERSLRYTEVEPNDIISEKEVELYNKWLKIIEENITEKYLKLYTKTSGSEKRARSTIHKLAQENARYMVSVFTPTTTTYTVPWIQINKVISYMEKVIKNPIDEFEKKLVPYFEEFIIKLKDLNVSLTYKNLYDAIKDDEEILEFIKTKHPNIIENKDSNLLYYKNTKDVELSLFANRNKFSGINSDNIYGASISYNNYESFACLAHENRHRSIECEMLIPKEFKFFVPPILTEEQKKDWENDMLSVKDVFPQGQLLKVNRIMSIRAMLKFVAQERACERAQLEIQDIYTNDIIPTVYKELENTNEKLAEEVKPYVKKLRCGFPGYKCPGTCGRPRIKRDI